MSSSARHPVSLVRRLWALVTLAYLATAALTAAVVVPMTVAALEDGLRAQALVRVAELARDFAARGPAEAPAVPPPGDAVLRTAAQGWIDEGRRQGWRRLLVLDARGQAVLGLPAADAGIVARLAGHWAGAAADAELRQGGRVLGRVVLVPDAAAAERRLGGVMLGWLLAFLASGAAMLFGLWRLQRWAMRPLETFDQQLRALAERQFIETPQPQVAEWVMLSRSINVLVARVRHLLAERDEVLRNLMARIEHDGLTGVSSREFFMSGLQAALRDAASGGGLAIVRVHDLDGLNRRLGRNRTDEFLVAVATALRTRLMGDPRSEGLVLARLNGADFGLHLPGASAEVWREQLGRMAQALQAIERDGLGDSPEVAWIGATTYLKGEAVSEALTRVDTMLLRAEAQQQRVCFAEPTARPALTTVMQWRLAIEQAIDTGHLSLDFHAAADSRGRPRHEVAALRLILPDGTVVAHDEVMPAAQRCGRISDLDLKAVELALSRLRAEPALQIAVPIATASAARPIFVRQLGELLQAHAREATRLALEMPDPGASADGAHALQQLGRVAAAHDCPLGVRQFGLGTSVLPLLRENALRYVKLADDLLPDEPATRSADYLRHLCRVVRAQGLEVLVDRQDRAAVLARLLDGSRRTREAGAPTA